MKGVLSMGPTPPSFISLTLHLAAGEAKWRPKKQIKLTLVSETQLIVGLLQWKIGFKLPNRDVGNAILNT